MVQRYRNTAEQPVQWSAEMRAHAGEYGMLTRTSRERGLSRPTLSRMKARALAGLHKTFAPPPATVAPPVARRCQ